MTAAPWQAHVRPRVEAIMRDHAMPGAVVAVARGHQAPGFLAVGSDAAGRPLAVDSLFPTASITKLATALAVLRLVDAGRLAVDDPLASHLPEAAAARTGVTIRALLTHTAGLPYFDPPMETVYGDGPSWPRLAEICLRTPPDGPPGRRVAYSNLGYGLAALVVERLDGRPFAAALRALVLDPLGIAAGFGDEPPRPPAVVGDVRNPRAGTALEALEPFNSRAWRSLAEPWAGLVTDAAGALALVRAFGGTPASFLRRDTAAAATRDQTGGLDGGIIGWREWPRCPWGLGPQLRGVSTEFAPAEASADSFGHGGLTGCIAWLDPARDLAWSIFGTLCQYDDRALERLPAISAAILASAR